MSRCQCKRDAVMKYALLSNCLAISACMLRINRSEIYNKKNEHPRRCDLQPCVSSAYGNKNLVPQMASSSQCIYLNLPIGAVINNAHEATCKSSIKLSQDCCCRRARFRVRTHTRPGPRSCSLRK